MERKSGVLMHISSLFGGYSIGSFSSAAEYFVDFLVDAGFGYWQVLPFCMPDEYGSPYKSYSSHGANPYFIDLEQLNAKGLITNGELLTARERTPYLCEYDRLAAERLELLRKASKRVTDREAVVRFCAERPELDTAAHFMALKTKNGGEPFWKWSVISPEDSELFLWRFIQYEFFIEWQKIKRYANERGVKIIGDVPIYVAHDSADVWATPEEYQLDKRYMPTAVAGVPPDYFSEMGQLWHNPLYDWQKMKKNGYTTWRKKIKSALSLFDGVRIDHFRGLEAYFSVPPCAKDARCGVWKKGPGRALIDAIREEAGEKLVIAEDLGDITDNVRKLLKYSGFPGMRVMQFGFLADPNSQHLPHNYPRNSVAYTGTHDNSTLLGFILEADEGTRKRILDYVGAGENDIRMATERAVHCLLSSHADLAIIPMQDVLGFGNDTRMNTPGIAGNNWAYRITKSQLDKVDRARWHYYNKLYARI